MRKYIGPAVVALIALAVIFGGAFVNLLTDWMWFKDLGYQRIFATTLWTKVRVGLLFGLVFFAIIYGNLWYARRIAPPPSPTGIEQQLIERLGRLARKGIGLLIFLASIVLSAMVGLEAATHWQDWLLYLHGVPFGITDPVFHKDIGFYVFKLPFLSYVYHWLFFALAASTIAAAALHYADEALESIAGRLQFAPGVKAHLAVLVAAMFFLKAWGYRLSMYDLLNVRGTIFDGPGYTELHANLPALWVLWVTAILAGLLVLLNIYRRGITYAVAALVLLVGASVVVGTAYPAMVQSFTVKPNELAKQRPYIRRAIKATFDAYGLNAVAAREFRAEPYLTAEQIQSNTPTIENIRLWDQLHLQDVYNQIQTIQQYYYFADLDVDRYWLAPKQGGRPRYRQVWLSARELDEQRLPSEAQTWINKRLQYTHGYGFAMSPVNEVNSEGLPQFFVKDMPPVASVDLPIVNPGVYFGELTENYVFVNTTAPEFDYPTGDKHKATSYKGDGGVRVGSFWRKLLFALRFSDVNILLNENIKSDSRILYYRNIRERTERLFPFLDFDNDPYLVVADGKLYWMRDAYTTTGYYPYSYHYMGGRINYIRNSVKVVVDAYTGRVNAYIIERPHPDPIIRTYARIFPGVFKNIREMSASLREHVRYPEDMFRVQTRVYARYHYGPQDPDGFYRNNDLWEIPKRALVAVAEGAEDGEMMEPYYVIMKLPNGSAEEFILMTPFIRAGGRKNMVAWMCARCDDPNYGNIVLYRFPEEKNVYGPQQIAGRASQDTQISQQLSLWNQEGSKVGSGNLLVIPIESSLLYVMPIYLVSTGTKIPELKRVIVAMGDRIAMEPTLDEALARVVGAPVSTPRTTSVVSAEGGAKRQPREQDLQLLIDKAVSQYEQAIEAQRRGDWAGYGRQIEALRNTLAELKSKSR
ncbi:MAG: UPF0182 family protein [Armatimonadota bacterium]|nr:UPF0182 family protein [Armatimonadota bacterium]